MNKLKSSSITYVNIMKKIKNRDTEFHTHKPKQKESFKIILKCMHPLSNVNDIRKEIEDQGYTVTNL